MAGSDCQYLGRFRLENNWILLPTVESEIFRVTHVPIEDIEGRYLKARIAVGIESNGKFNPYEPQLLTYTEDPRIIPLEGFPKELGIPRLGVQRLDESPVAWDVLIEAFPAVNAQDNLVDEIVKRIMTYFDLDQNDEVQLIPKQQKFTVEKNQPLLLAGANHARRFLTIKNFGQSELVLGRDAEVDPANGNVKALNQRFESIPASKGYPLPNDNGCIYKGDVYALPKFDGEVEVIEWEKQVMANNS